MTCFERIDAAVNLRVADRVPVAPLIIGYAGSCAGVTQGEIYLDLGAWMRALAMTYGEIGECDAVFPVAPRRREHADDGVQDTRQGSGCLSWSRLSRRN